MKLIYVASPYAGDVERNVEYAKQACRTVMEMGLTLLHRCDELWAFGPCVSSGMQAEIAEAERLRIPVRRMDVSEELAPERTLDVALCG